jgi:hypothetical protein
MPSPDAYFGPAALDLRGRDPAAFVREVEDEAVRIVVWYAPRTESLRSWDIRGSNVLLNRVFELNRLPYGGYLGDDAVAAVDRRGKKPVAVAEEGPSREAASATKISSAAAAKDVTGSVSQQLRHALRQLKHVSLLGLR